MTLDHAGEGGGLDQIATIVSVVEDRAVAFETARRRSLVDELVFEHKCLALGTAGGRFRLVDQVDQFSGCLLDRAVALLRRALLGRDQATGQSFGLGCRATCSAFASLEPMAKFTL